MIRQIRQYFVDRKARKRYLMLSLMIDSIDRQFEKKGVGTSARNKFWYDLIYNPESRKQFIKEMGKKYVI